MYSSIVKSVVFDLSPQTIVPYDFTKTNNITVVEFLISVENGLCYILMSLESFW